MLFLLRACFFEFCFCFLSFYVSISLFDFARLIIFISSNARPWTWPLHKTRSVTKNLIHHKNPIVNVGTSFLSLTSIHIHIHDDSLVCFHRSTVCAFGWLLKLCLLRSHSHSYLFVHTKISTLQINLKCKQTEHTRDRTDINPDTCILISEYRPNYAQQLPKWDSRANKHGNLLKLKQATQRCLFSPFHFCRLTHDDSENRIGLCRDSSCDWTNHFGHTQKKNKNMTKLDKSNGHYSANVINVNNLLNWISRQPGIFFFGVSL